MSLGGMKINCTTFNVLITHILIKTNGVSFGQNGEPMEIVRNVTFHFYSNAAGMFYLCLGSLAICFYSTNN